MSNTRHRDQQRVRYEGALYTAQELATLLGIELGKGVTAKLIANRMSRGVGYTKAVTQHKQSPHQAARMGARKSPWRGQFAGDPRKADQYQRGNNND